MFKVTYNAKNVDKASTQYGYVAFDKSRKFETLQDAFKYVRLLKNGKSDKYEVVGMPVIERV